ncbi:hypothetical protein C5167_030399, partial [Papaver somniferum]
MVLPVISQSFNLSRVRRRGVTPDREGVVMLQKSEPTEYRSGAELFLAERMLTEQADVIIFVGEVDRVYLSTPTKIAIIDHEKKRYFVLRKESMLDAGSFNLPSTTLACKNLYIFRSIEFKFCICIRVLDFNNRCG